MTFAVAAARPAVFGDEADSMPSVAAILIGADADNTGGCGRAQVASLEWLP